MAVRRRRISVRTRVRLGRFTSARWRDCAARFKTDFFFFLTLVACPCAIYRSFGVFRKLLTVNEAFPFVKRTKRHFSQPGGSAVADQRHGSSKSPRKTIRCASEQTRRIA